jgi:hypothetical protein
MRLTDTPRAVGPDKSVDACLVPFLPPTDTNRHTDKRKGAEAGHPPSPSPSWASNCSSSSANCSGSTPRWACFSPALLPSSSSSPSAGAAGAGIK